MTFLCGARSGVMVRLTVHHTQLSTKPERCVDPGHPTFVPSAQVPHPLHTGWAGVCQAFHPFPLSFLLPAPQSILFSLNASYKSTASR